MCDKKYPSHCFPHPTWTCSLFHPFHFPQFPINEGLCSCPSIYSLLFHSNFPPSLLCPSDPPTLSFPIRRLGPQWVCVLSSEVLYSPVQSHALQFRLALSILPLIPLNGNPSAGLVFTDWLSPLCVSSVLNWCTMYTPYVPLFHRGVAPPFCF